MTLDKLVRYFGKMIVTCIVFAVSYAALKAEWFVLDVPIWQLTVGLLMWAALVWIFLVVLWLVYVVLMFM